MSAPMMVEIADVSFAYDGVAVLKGLSGRVHPGESVALVGDNGAGKTTVTRLLMGLEQPDRGRVTVGGVKPVEPSVLTAQVGYVFQHPVRQLFARSVYEEMLFSCRQLGRPAAAALKRADMLLERIGLPEIATIHPHDLSPGQQKLMAFASALTHEPRLLILDEPTQGLDRRAREILTALIREHVQVGGLALTVTHDAAFVVEVSDRIWYLAGGRMAADEATTAAFRDQTSAARLGLPVPPVAVLANHMGWGPDSRRVAGAKASVQSALGGPTAE